MPLKVIVLNGASSSGKSTFAKSLVCEELGNPKIIEITIIVPQSQQNSYTASKTYRNLRKNLREIQFSKGIV